jgi:hypothetical protein
MSMMMPPDPAALGGAPMPPGGGMPGEGLPPRGMEPPGPMPGEGGIEALMAALGGGGGMPPPEEMGGMPPEMGGEIPPELGEAAMAGSELEEMSPVDHIRQAMKHLMMAMAGDEDDERGAGVVKGMGALQAILGGEQKKSAMMGPGPVGG